MRSNSSPLFFVYIFLFGFFLSFYQIVSAQVAASVAPPRNLKIVSQTDSTVTLSWESSATNFLIRSRDLTDLSKNTLRGGSFKDLNDTYRSKTITLNNMVPGNRYYFWIHSGVLAVNADGTPKYSEKVDLEFVFSSSKVSLPPTIPAPKNLTLVSQKDSSVTLSWEGDASNYLIRSKDLTNDFNNVLNDGQQKDYNDTYRSKTITLNNMIPGNRYYFWVHAGTLGTNPDGTLKYSNQGDIQFVFTPEVPMYDLEVTKTGSGSVTGGGINCGSDCKQEYEASSVVELTAVPAEGYEFSGWSGACSGTNVVCRVTISQNRSVAAAFALKKAVVVNPPTNLVIAETTDSTATIRWEGTATNYLVRVKDLTDSTKNTDRYGTLFASDTYKEKSKTIQLVPGHRYAFWVHAGTLGTNPDGSFKYSEKVSLESVFTPKVPMYALDVTKTDLGSVTGGGINCGSDCREEYQALSVVELTATPVSGYSFSSWTGCSSTKNTCTVTMNGNKAVTANFEKDIPVCLGFQTQSCSVANGIGEQRKDCGQESWTSCLAVSCNTGYELKNNVCVERKSQPLTSPRILSPINNEELGSERTTVTLAWEGEATNYLVRVKNLTDSTKNTQRYGTMFASDTYKEKSKTINVVPGHRYEFWVHAGELTNYSAEARISFSVEEKIIVPPLPEVCRLSSASWSGSEAEVGSSVILQTTGTGCDTAELKYTIYEDKLLFDKELVTFTGEKDIPWTVSFYGEPADKDIKYYFQVSVVGDERNKVKSSNPKLTVENPKVAQNGVCGSANGSSFASMPTVNLCETNQGTPTSVVELGNAYLWTCKGMNGGVDSSMCSAIKKEASLVPRILSPINNEALGSDRTSATLAWEGEATNYLVRVKDLTDSTKNTDKYGTLFASDTYKEKSKTINVVPGHRYEFWVHGGALANPSAEARISFSVEADASCPVTEETESCLVTNGVGEKVRRCSAGTWSDWTSCSVLSCNGGYELNNGACVVAPERPPVVDSCSSGKAKVITQFGITWTMDKEYPCGQFANGDYWVKGPVIITNITPKDPNLFDDTDIHGTMINPEVSTSGQKAGDPKKKQGWDSRIKYFTRSMGPYDPSVNIARQLPKAVSVNSSVVSVESHIAGATQDNPQMKTAAVLTVLPVEPAAGSFRPPLVGTDKTVKWNKSQLNYGILKKLAPVSSTPNISVVASWFERPWIEKETGWTGRYMHPDLNYPNRDKGTAGTFGREIAYTAEAGLLSLQLNYTDVEKAPLYIRLVQAGIDVYGAAKNGGYWGDGGGHNQGRKMVLLLAGKALNDADILEYADAKKSPIFQEDLQIFTVTAPDTVRSDGTMWYDNNTKQKGEPCSKQGGVFLGVNCTPIEAYTQAHIDPWKAKGLSGMPEWAINYKDQPNRTNYRWDALYRTVAGSATFGAMTTAVLMGLENEWNNPAFFDYYQQRYWPVEGPLASGTTNRIQTFTANMYRTHVLGTGNKQCTGFDTQACSVANGVGEQTKACDATDWSACMVTGCNTGYELKDKVCVEDNAQTVGSPRILSPINNEALGSDRTSATLAWEGEATNYLVRVKDLTDSTKNTDKYGTLFASDTYKEKSKTINVVPGHRYEFWVHGGALANPSEEARISFSVEADAIFIGIDGACGSANGGSFVSIPENNLCNAGTPTGGIQVGETYTWTCAGIDGGSDAVCNAFKENNLMNACGTLEVVSSSSENLAYESVDELFVGQDASWSLKSFLNRLTTSVLVNKEPTLTIGSPEVVYNKLASMFDGSGGPLKDPKNPGKFFTWQSNGNGYFSKYRGSEIDPFDEEIWTLNGSIASRWNKNGYPKEARAQEFAASFDHRPWLNRVYRHDDGTLIGFVHVETDQYFHPKKDENGNRMVNYRVRYRQGIAISTDNGDHWKYVGDVIKPDWDGFDPTVKDDPKTVRDERYLPANLGGIPMLVVGDYFYQYFNEYPENADGSRGRRVPAVARAKVQDVVAAAKSGTVTPWVKYNKNKGGWTQDAMTGVGSSVLPGYDFYDMHTNAIYSPALGKYLLLAWEQSGWNYKPVNNSYERSQKNKGHYLYSSTDGVNWVFEQKLYTPIREDEENPYPFFVGGMNHPDTTDDFRVIGGNEFYVYFSFRSSKNHSEKKLYRVKLTVNNGNTGGGIVKPPVVTPPPTTGGGTPNSPTNLTWQPVDADSVLVSWDGDIGNYLVRSSDLTDNSYNKLNNKLNKDFSNTYSQTSIQLNDMIDGHEYAFWVHSGVLGTNPDGTNKYSDRAYVNFVFDSEEGGVKPPVGKKASLTLQRNCPGGLSETLSTQEYEEGTTVRLKATAKSGYTFSNWSSSCRNVNGDCEIKLSGDMIVTGTFVKDGAIFIGVDGVCGSANGGSFVRIPENNLCNAGTPTVVTQAGETYTWTCAGIDGGADSSMCSATGKDESLVPKILSPINNEELGSERTTVTLAWEGEATNYLVRVKNLTDSTKNTERYGTMFASDTYKEKSKTINVVPGHRYEFWVHAGELTNYSAEARISFSVEEKIILPPLPEVCRLSSASWSGSEAEVGSSVILQTTGTGCDTAELKYTIYEDKLLFDKELVTFTGEKDIPWTVSFYGEPADKDIKYYFQASVVGDERNKVKSSNPKLTVENPKVAQNGVCGSANGSSFTSMPTVNLCEVNQGTPTSVVELGNAYLWTCKGMNGGVDSSMCSAIKKDEGGVLRILSPINNEALGSDRTSATLAWEGEATNYLVRVKDLTDSTKNTDKYGTLFASDTYKEKSKTVTVTPGHEYEFWVHAGELTNYSAEARINFRVEADASCPVTEETESCLVTNGVGEKVRRCSAGTWSDWTACTVLSCNGGYELNNGACVVAPVRPPVVNSCASGKAKVITQFGITWTMDKEYPCGQFANGDYWVVGPVTISDINPKTDKSLPKESHLDGSMINLMPSVPGTDRKQGFRSAWSPHPQYDPNLNIVLKLPHTVSQASSLYSTMNNPDRAASSNPEKTFFKETAVLTILLKAPAAGSFRPPYAGADKTIKSNWNVASLNYGVLGRLTPPNVNTVPNREWLEEATKRPLLELHRNYQNSQWKASWEEFKDSGYPRRTYGREVGHISNGAGLYLQTDVSNKEKEKLLINMVQWGIDVYGLRQVNFVFQPNGGHQLGRLMPLYLAGKVLGDNDMLAQIRPGTFQELTQHWIVTQNEVDTPRNPASILPYTPSHIGMAEWSSGGPGERNQASPAWRDGEPGYTGYRVINGAPNTAFVATVLLMGGRNEINYEPLFRYIIERYYPSHRGGARHTLPNYGDSISLFTRDMWDTYIKGGVSQLPSAPVCLGFQEQSCPVSNGIGEQRKDCGQEDWSSCLAVSCNGGYELKNGACVVAPAKLPVTPTIADLVVDFSKPLRAANGRASGFLHGLDRRVKTSTGAINFSAFLTATDPRAVLYKDLKPKMVREPLPQLLGKYWNYSSSTKKFSLGSTFDSNRVNYIKNTLGADITWMSGGETGWPNSWNKDSKGKIIPINKDPILWPKYQEFLRFGSKALRNAGYTNIRYDVWNEPNLAKFYAGTEQEFFDLYLGVRTVIRAEDPRGKIIAPCINNYNFTWLKSFIDRAANASAMPDVFCWHELDYQYASGVDTWGNPSGLGIEENIQEVQNYLATKGYSYGRDKFEINEYVNKGNAIVGHAGALVANLSELDAAGVTHAARACWQETNGDDTTSGCYAGTVNLLTQPDMRPRGVYWVAKAYADQSGQILGFENQTRNHPKLQSKGLWVQPSYDASKRQGSVIIGNIYSGAHSNFKVGLKNIPNDLVGNGQIYVVVKDMPSGKAAANPTVVQQGYVSVQNSSAVITIPQIKGTGAYVLEYYRTAP